MRISSFRKYFAFVLTALALSACGNNSELSWTEEVKLADGRIIVVKRYSEFKAPHEIGQPSGESYMRMEFEHPITKEMVRYESKLFATTPEMEKARAKPVSDPGVKHRPYALMLRGDDLYVVTHIDSNIDDFLGCPDPPFLLYLWKRGIWERRSLEEIPLRQFVPNVTIDPLLARPKITESSHS